MINYNSTTKFYTLPSKSIEWIGTNFTFDGVNLWKRKELVKGNYGNPGMTGLLYTTEQVIEAYLRENGTN